MSAQMALPGFAPVEVDDPQPDPLTEARAEAARLHAEWLAVCHIADSDERTRLQPLLRAALVRVDLLVNGPRWYH